MVLVYLYTGECIEVEDADRAERRGDTLVCLTDSGDVTMTFEAKDVESYTANEIYAEQFKEEVCEDLTVVTSESEGELEKA